MWREKSAVQCKEGNERESREEREVSVRLFLWRRPNEMHLSSVDASSFLKTKSMNSFTISNEHVTSQEEHSGSRAQSWNKKPNSNVCSLLSSLFYLSSFSDFSLFSLSLSFSVLHNRLANIAHPTSLIFPFRPSYLCFPLFCWRGWMKFSSSTILSSSKVWCWLVWCYIQ